MQLVLTVAVTWFIVRQVGVGLDEAMALDQALPAVRWLPLALSSVLLLAGFGAAAALWGRMARELGGPALRPGTAARIVFTANLGRYLPGKVWQMAGLALLARRAGMSATLGATAGVLGQTFLLAGAAVWGASLLAGLEGGGPWPMLALGVLGLFLVVATVPALFRGLVGAVFRLGRVPREHLPAFDTLFGLRWLVAYVALWAIYVTAFVVLLRGLGFEGGFFELGPPFAAAYLLGYVAVFAPAGIGVREGFLIAFLRPELGAAAVGVAIVARIWMTVVELLPAGALALAEVFRRPTPAPPGPTHLRPGPSDTGSGAEEAAQSGEAQDA